MALYHVEYGSYETITEMFEADSDEEAINQALFLDKEVWSLLRVEEDLSEKMRAESERRVKAEGERYRQENLVAAEAKERAELARLKAKYEGVE